MPKIIRIQDYERTIEEMTKRQLTWDDSPEMREFREQKARMDHFEAEYVKLQQSVESLEAANEHLADTNT